MTYDEYLAKKKASGAAPGKLEAHAANEGADNDLWKGAIQPQRDSDENYFVGKTKFAPKARAKTEKVRIETDAGFAPSERDHGRGSGEATTSAGSRFTERRGYLDHARPTPPPLTSTPAKHLIIPEHNGKPLFDPGDGDIELQVNGAFFETHKYLLKRFNVLKDMLREHISTTNLKLKREDQSVEDFTSMFKLLYASVLEGPFEFDNRTLVSALRIATLYDYPALRAYAIKHLEQAQLTAIERIRIGREFGLVSWEDLAFQELCMRDEAITMEEASAIGLETFVRIAKMREGEKEQRIREKEVGAQIQGRARELERRRDGEKALGATNPPKIVSTSRRRTGGSSQDDTWASRLPAGLNLTQNERQEASTSAIETTASVRSSRPDSPMEPHLNETPHSLIHTRDNAAELNDCPERTSRYLNQPSTTPARLSALQMFSRHIQRTAFGPQFSE